MAGFKTHITTSSVLGVGYTGLGLHLGIPWESSVIAGGLCGIGGMLPDIDSDSGIPFRESMSFFAAIIPIMMLDRLRALGLNYEEFVLAVGGIYLFVRFGLARLLAKYTVHRGMFHSLPAALIFAGVVFLVSGSSDLQLRYFKAWGVFCGVMSHLILDEIYSVEWKGGRWRFKKSFGTAVKLWGNNTWSNLTTYAKLALVVLMILGEPMVMQRYGEVTPLAINRSQITNGLAGAAEFGNSLVPYPTALPDETAPPESADILPPNVAVTPQPGPYPGEVFPEGELPPGGQQPPPEADRTIYDTARRLWNQLRE